MVRSGRGRKVGGGGGFVPTHEIPLRETSGTLHYLALREGPCQWVFRLRGIPAFLASRRTLPCELRGSRLLTQAKASSQNAKTLKVLGNFNRSCTCHGTNLNNALYVGHKTFFPVVAGQVYAQSAYSSRMRVEYIAH